jgi:hypothetical protein
MLNFANSIAFFAGQEPPVSLRNYWPPSNGFVWSTGKWCELSFEFELGSKAVTGLADLILDIGVFKVDQKLPGQNVAIFLNGLRIGTFFCKARITYIAQFDARILKSEKNILIFDTPESARPSDFGSDDKRLLGIQLFSLQIRRAG